MHLLQQMTDYMGAAVVVKNPIIEVSKDRKYKSLG